jgi:transcriptional regulator with GAF, ATPase, and Fis domain/uncharacterized protein HemY
MLNQNEYSGEASNNSEKILHLFELSRNLVNNNLKEAKKNTAKALLLAKQNNDQENICRALNLLAEIARKEGKIDKAFKYCKKCQEIAKAIGNKKSEAACYLTLGLIYWHKGEFEKANLHLEEALKLYHELYDQNGIACSYNDLSLVHWERGDLEKALKYQELCLEIKERLGNSQAVGISYLNLGLIYEDLGDWEKSIECFFRSLVEKERNQDKAGIVLCYNNIGEIYLKRRSFDKALKFFNEALRLANETNSLQNKAEVLGNIGYIHFLNNDLVSAIAFYNEDLDISAKLNDKDELAEIHRRIAEIRILTEPQKCHSLLNKALRFASSATSRKELGNVKRVFGKFYAKVENHTEAESSFQASIEILKAMSKGYELAETYRDFGKYLVENGAKQEGINYLKESIRIFDRLDIPIESETIESFLIQLEGEKAKELSLLKRLSALSNHLSSLEEFLPNCLRLFYETLNFQDGVFYVFGHRPIIIGSISSDEAMELGKKSNFQSNPSSILIPLKTDGENTGILYFKWSRERTLSFDPAYWEIIANIISLGLTKMKILSRIEIPAAKQNPFFKGVVGETETVKAILEMVEQVAPTHACVLIRGESGTGKELMAKTIHEMSGRVDKPFITINCSAIPETLLESELFGIERGTATGVWGRKGKFEQANEGTVFLDEIGDMSPSLQAKILRALQEKTFERVGGRTTTNVDIRVIAATNKDLEKEIKNENFREDLYHRLNVIPLFLPPLRDRRQDIPLFVEYFIDKFAKEFAKSIKGVSNNVLQSFLAYAWPGNIRELENILERGVILAKNSFISLDDLPPHFKQVYQAQSTSSGSSRNMKGLIRQASEENLGPIKKDFIIQTLVENKHNVSKAARAIGINRSHFYRLMKNYQIKRRQYKKK